MRERNWASYIRPISARYMHAKEVQYHQRYHERYPPTPTSAGLQPSSNSAKGSRDNAQASANKAIKAIKAIARDLHVSRKVIRKAIRAPEGAFDYQRDAPRKSLPHLPNR